MSEEEIEREISERVTGLAREMHEKEKREFEKLQQCFGKLECKKDSDQSTLELERLRVENEQLKERLEEYQSREVSFKSLLPTTRVIERYQAALLKLNNELTSSKVKLKDKMCQNQELTKAYMSCKARFDILEEERNEAVKRQEFAERRCNELMRTIRRQDVGIDIDPAKRVDPLN